MRIDEFEFQDRNGNEIEPTKNQLVVYIKSLHKQIAELEKQLAEKEKYTYTGKEVGEIERKYDEKIDTLEQQLQSQPAEICQELIDMLTDRAELIEAGLCAEFMFTVYDLRESIEEILKEYQK